MTLKQLMQWTCDLCGVVVEGEPPKGWRWYRGGVAGRISHACPVCEVPEGAVSAPLGLEARR